MAAATRPIAFRMSSKRVEKLGTEVVRKQYERDNETIPEEAN